MTITALDLAQRFIGIREIAGGKNHPLVSWWLSLCGFDLATPDVIAKHLEAVVAAARVERTPSLGRHDVPARPRM